MDFDKTTSIKSQEKKKWKSVSLSDERFEEFDTLQQDDEELNHEKGLFKKRYGMQICKNI